MNEPVTFDCPAENVIAQLQGKWTVQILAHLKAGPVRFGALRRAIGAISQKVLTYELRSLVEHGIVSRQVRAESPILNVEYGLTKRGHDVTTLLADLDRWSVEHAVPERAG